MKKVIVAIIFVTLIVMLFCGCADDDIPATVDINAQSHSDSFITYNCAGPYGSVQARAKANPVKFIINRNEEAEIHFCCPECDEEFTETHTAPFSWSYKCKCTGSYEKGTEGSWTEYIVVQLVLKD